MKLLAWLSWKLLFSKGSHFYSGAGWLALGGLAIGVASLTVSMAVVSGFERTLQKSVTDITGHIQVLRANSNDQSDITDEVKKISSDLTGITPFTMFHAVLAYQGRLNGIFVQGIDSPTYKNVLRLEDRLQSGAIDFSKKDSIYGAVIGRGIAKNFGLKLGDVFNVVVPLRSDLSPTDFKRKLAKFYVSGIVDLAKNEYNERFILTDIQASRDLVDFGERSSGFLLRFKDIDQVAKISLNMKTKMGGYYRIKDWFDLNENLLRAIQIERWVIFFVVLVIVLAAAFNVSTQLYIHVVKKYPAIGLLKSLGVKNRQIMTLFSFQALILGGTGLILGLMLGTLLCFGFVFIEKHFGILPGEIYRIDRIDLFLRPFDLILIVMATLGLCMIAAIPPAWRGAKLQPVEGLRNV